MSCENKCFGEGTASGPIEVPGTYDNSTPWKFYNHLIAEIPEDILVTDCCVGTNWCYVEAECGMGVSYTVTGGGRPVYDGAITGLPLRSVAELSKSWNFREATIGVAALNAWYSQLEKVEALGGKIAEDTGHRGHIQHGEADDPVLNEHYATDPFVGLKDAYTGKKVTVIGHFPGVEEMAELCDLTVLERDPHGRLDTPDPACEYVLPSQDFVFTTGVILINKTAPRILDLSKNATVVMVGPSVIASPFLFKWGVDILAGRVVLDAETVRRGVKQGSSFGGMLRMFSLDKPSLSN